MANEHEPPVRGYPQFEWDAELPPDRTRDAKRAKHFAEQLPRNWDWFHVVYPSWGPRKCPACGAPPAMHARRTDRLEGGEPEPPEFEIHCGLACPTIWCPSDTPEEAIADYERRVQGYLNGERCYGE